MSEKIVDLKDLRKLINPSVVSDQRKLIEQRFEEEVHDQVVEDRHKKFMLGAPPIPQAQLVYNHESGKVGVAVRGAKLICPLPKGYTGEGLELAIIEGERLIVTHPNMPPLLIEPQTGTTRRL